MEVGNTEAVKHAVMADLGIAFVSQYAVADEVETGRLRLVQVKALELAREHWLLTPADGYQPRVIQVFLPFLEQLQAYFSRGPRQRIRTGQLSTRRPTPVA